jgi:hypothetical protein
MSSLNQFLKIGIVSLIERDIARDEELQRFGEYIIVNFIRFRSIRKLLYGCL